jgi:hypothetical protein
MKLDYVFRCKFHDGTYYLQTPDDVSLTTPGRSAFFDIVPRLAEIETFSITNGRDALKVDLRDGSFELNGMKFHAGNPDVPRGNGYELVYFRRRQEHFTTDGKRIGGSCEYHVGWTNCGQKVTVSLPSSMYI